MEKIFSNGNLNNQDTLNNFKFLFKKAENVYAEIQKIIIIALNDIFFEEHLNILDNNKLVIDTFECISKSNYDMNKLFDLEKLEKLYEHDREEFNNNKFISLSKDILNVMNDPLILKQKENNILLDKINNENLKISKKNYEVEILANFMIDKISQNSTNIAIEMGCGKSYLTERLFEFKPDLVYIGIDKQKDLIINSNFNQKNINNIKYKNKNKNKNKNKKDKIIKNDKSSFVQLEEKTLVNNTLLYDLHIDNEFYNFYENTIKQEINLRLKDSSILLNPNKKINENLSNEEKINAYTVDMSNLDIKKREDNYNNKNTDYNILLFGLHSCGNLSSDSIKIFAEKSNTEFKSLIIISCCLHLVKEFISNKAKNNKLFIDHISKIGYDPQGNFLDETLVYNNTDENIGYPISYFIKENYEELFFTRTVRKSAMQSFPEKENKVIKMEDFFYKTRFFRSLFQIFLIEYIPELSNYYGYGDVEYDEYEKNDFHKFISYLKINLAKLKNEKNKIGKKFKELKIENYEDILNKYEELLNNRMDNLLVFYEKYFVKINLLWACFLIKMKFSKVVELMVILDRVIYLAEKGIENIELVEIFDSSKSKRNYLIYANKIKI